MKKPIVGWLLWCLLLSFGCGQSAWAQADQLSAITNSAGRWGSRFDNDWRFHLGGALGAETVAFDDSDWRVVDLPHDWSIEDLPGRNSPFAPDAISQVNGGFTTGGTGWYRTKFVLPAEFKGKRVILQFDGVYMNADVWLNGAALGRHPYGYTSFSFDASGAARPGGTNVLAVKVQNEGDNSRWYSGSGIYRHVWLKALDPLHVAQWGNYISTPGVTEALANLLVKTKGANESSEALPVELVTRILDPRGAVVATARSQQAILPGESLEFVQTCDVPSPQLWGLEQQPLYTCVTEVHRGKELADQTQTRFGIRSLAFDVDRGFLLNGKAIKLKGGCSHHDNGPLGAKAYDRAEERKIELLKAAGFNAVRCSHNPPSPALLDACDRLGMLVIDEAFDMWTIEKNPFDYHLYFEDWWKRDLESMVSRDCNHPSIIMWSIGNEIPQRQKPEVIAVAKMLGDFIRQLEPSRPITSAVNDLGEKQDPFFRALDVAGYNYAVGGDHNQKSVYELDHARVPDRIIYCSESYPLEAFGSWMAVLDHPYVLGDFVWTAWDYIGEASIGWRGYFQFHDFYPWTLAYCGDIDICGWKRPQSFYRDALWKEGQISLFVKPPQPSFKLNPKRESWSKWHFHDLLADWTWPGQEGKPLEVAAFSSCEEVELVANGKSLGRKPTTRATEFWAGWSLPYQPGTLVAIGYSGGKKVATIELRTASSASRLKLQADRTTLHADNQDLSYVTVELIDREGVRLPKAENLVQFEIEGPATIAGVGNANPTSTESYQQPRRKAWHGRCLVVIKAGQKPGEAVLRAMARGIKTGEIRLRIE
jgi:beta-galactosidase